MTDSKMEIPELVWITLHEARVRMLVGAGYPEFAAVEFADTEQAWRKRAVEVLGPEGALLSDLMWVHGEGSQIHWGLDFNTPPVPRDIATLA